MRKWISTFLVLWLVWVLIAGFALPEVLLGGAAALILSLVIARFVSYSFTLRGIAGGFKFLFVFIPVFLYKLVLANLDIAYRVLSPSLPINPKIVKVPTSLKSDFLKLVLANAITLTPGTLSLDVEEDGLLIHWVNAQGDTAEDYQKAISRDFETLLGGEAQ
ncbi:MAG TPA: Na+/H+ antiporter subunit E [Candidatus Limiplasma sp.]|mgnify:CR=1 FL=1|nr:Na+/H+ antiporter subunit E [Candidatus Limiplasma sp.]HRX09401.1 Na+/H+ antiporter subunit E [Candidatus Limiplasma sp.]